MEATAIALLRARAVGQVDEAEAASDERFVVSLTRMESALLAALVQQEVPTMLNDLRTSANDDERLNVLCAIEITKRIAAKFIEATTGKNPREDHHE